MEWVRLPSSSTHSPLSGPREVELQEGEDSSGSTPDDSAGPATTAANGLRKELRFVDGLCVCVGVMVGSGIFSSPGTALSSVGGSAPLCLLAWALSGLIVCVCATCYFELHSLFPNAGGDYSYLQAAYGDRAAFSFAWFNVLISKTGSQAIIATIFGRYLEQVLLFVGGGGGGGGGSSSESSEHETPLSKALALFLVVGSTALNCVSVQSSTSFQNALTGGKLAAVSALFVASLAVALISPQVTLGDAFSAHGQQKNQTEQIQFGSALVAALWSFDGWCDVVFLSEELREPKALPHIVLSAVAIVTTLYLGVNTAYLLLLTTDEVQSSRAIGMVLGDRLNSVLGLPAACSPAIFIACVVVVSTASSANGSIMSGGRAFFAVARGGKFPALMARVNSAGAPYVSLLVQGLWAALLILLPGSGFSSLLDYFGPCSWAFYAFSASAVVVLRQRGHAAEAAYRVPYYPLPPLIVVTVAAGIVVSSLMRSPIFTLLAFGIVALSVPFHMCFLERRRDGPAAPLPRGDGEPGADAIAEDQAEDQAKVDTSIRKV